MESIFEDIENDFVTLDKMLDLFDSIDTALLSKIHYIFFPIHDIESLLSKFESL